MLVLKILFLLCAYVYGSLPITEYLASRKGVDLRTSGTGKVGPGNLWQTTGAINGIIGGLADLSKGAIPYFVARSIGLDRAIACAAALAGVAGQMWPLFRGLDGGQGNSSSLGLALALSPRAFLLAIIPMLTGGALWAHPIVSQTNLPWRMRMKFRSKHSDEIPLGMVTGWVGLPIFSWIMGEPKSVTRAFATAVLLLVVRRLTAELSEDMSSGRGLKRALIARLLYDRPAR